MIKILLWALCLYLVFKLCHLNFSPKKNFAYDDRSLRDKLIAGEPYVILIAVAAAALINLYSYWFVHRLARREVAHATECYGRVGASQKLAGINTRFDYWLLETFTADARNIAIEHAKWINMDLHSVQAGLQSSKAKYSAVYYKLSSRNNVQKINQEETEIERCVNDQWAPHGEILNP